MNENLKLDDAGYALIKKWEGVKTRAYSDSVGIPTSA